MRVDWIEQTKADVPPQNNWLSPEETAYFNSLRFARRSADWRLGRWTSKCAVATFLNLPAHPQALATIEIWPAPSGAPEAFLDGVPVPVAISISHRDGISLCAIASSNADVGCDLEMIEPRSEAFIADYFAPPEQALISNASSSDRFLTVALLWSAKESALKALRQGLRLDTRSVIVSLADHLSRDEVIENKLRRPDSSVSDPPALNSWSSLGVQCCDGKTFHGWWQTTTHTVRTLVANPRPDPPILLDFSNHDLPGKARSDEFLDVETLHA